MLKQPTTFVESLVVSAVSAALERLGTTWQEVANSLQEDHEIDFQSYRQGEFLADDNPLAAWANMYFPKLSICADEQGLIGYLPDTDGEEFTVSHTAATAVFMFKWINDEIWS